MFRVEMVCSIQRVGVTRCRVAPGCVTGRTVAELLLIRKRLE